MPDICLWNRCNNRCIMCTNDEEFSSSDPNGNYDIVTQIKKMKLYLNGKQDVYYSNSDRKDYINITGGEPTTHPYFLQIMKYIVGEFKDIQITLLTNGRRFKDDEFAKKFCSIASENFRIAISFHSYDEKTFDKITGIKGSFKETTNGILNLYKHFKGIFEFRIVIHKLNIKDLYQTILFLKNLMFDRNNWYIVIIHYEIEGIALKNYKKIELKLSDSASVISSIDEEILKSARIRLYHYPLCILEERLRKYAWITLPIEERVYPKKCDKCKLKDKCLGLMKEYYNIYGDEELKPIYK